MTDREEALLLGVINAIEGPRGVAESRGFGRRVDEGKELIDQCANLIVCTAAQGEAQGIGLSAVIPSAQGDEDAIDHPAWRGGREVRISHTFGGDLTRKRGGREGC